MFRRLMIANRGEVAQRVTRTAKRMGIEVVVIASTADKDQQWLNEADEVVVIGPPRSSESYLDQCTVLEVARKTNSAAIHPGWGFLAENDIFAARCQALGLTFVGPSARHIKQFGDKSLARATMTNLGLAPIPGSKEAVSGLAEAERVAAQVGFPVLLKAVAGGGGKGMRPVDGPSNLATGLQQASSEALASFGDGRVYIERLIRQGRHIEFQIMADAYGNVVVVGDRECSLQRRHQKVLEEAPAAGLSQAERERLLPILTEAIRKSGYTNAGTVEMLMDEHGTAWFMEMNTRLQVEHSVTELVTGLDLVELQLRVAAGERLPLKQEDVVTTGHAIECRINAEDPANGFKPSPGRVTKLRFPEGDGIRVDTHLREGDKIPPYYDSMVAKLMVHGSDRADAIARMRAALEQTEIEGVTTNIDLHKAIGRFEPFVDGSYNTTSLEKELMETAWRDSI